MPPRSSPLVLLWSMTAQPVAVSVAIWNCEVKVSSALPLQLSSAPLQVSVAGTTSPAHVVLQVPTTQVCVPLRQMPTPAVPDGPE